MATSEHVIVLHADASVAMTDLLQVWFKVE